MIFFVDEGGRIVGRTTGVSDETWHYIFQVVESHARREPLNTETMPFGIRHPTAAMGKPVPVIGLTDISGNPVSMERFHGRVTMVYFFVPGGGPCELATKVTRELYDEFHDRVQFIAVAPARSANTLRWARVFALQYGRGESWAASLPKEEQELQQYVTQDLNEIKKYAQENFPFPVFVDWDDQTKGVWGMGLAGFPSWAILDQEGRLVEAIPGGAARYNLNGKFLETTSPPPEWLREMLNAALARSETQ
ncbi:MAG: TlpA family protein disulfide reductase [Candidatus Bipolaricaulaceae bacterium]